MMEQKIHMESMEVREQRGLEEFKEINEIKNV